MKIIPVSFVIGVGFSHKNVSVLVVCSFYFSLLFLARYHPMLELLKTKRFNLDGAFYKRMRDLGWIEDLQQ